MTAETFARLLVRLGERGLTTLADALEASRRVRTAAI
jgi:hypothetical protein